jgi:hypothetical protein
MALTKCSECGHDISTEAKSCQNCGAKPKKHVGILGYTLLGLFILFVIMVANGSNDNNSSTQTSPPDPMSEQRFQKTLMAATAVKQSLRNPASVIWDDIFTNQDGSSICVKYRAQNGFGGMNIEHVVFVNGKPYQTNQAWNKHCVGNNFFDEKYVRNAL